MVFGSLNKLLTMRRKLLLLISVTMLIIPAIAMQFTDEVDWSAFDFLVAAILLGGAGLLIDHILTRFQKRSHRLLMVSLVLLALLVVWAELAVGLFGSPFAGS
ncbi:MAG: hypothetical protein KDB88_09630 [Flavobacteriales bacterium]|nr:hypothetical protein [Flavobacteriales bacterium]